MYDYKFRVTNKELKDFAQSLDAPIVVIGNAGHYGAEKLPFISNMCVRCYHCGQFGWDWDAYTAIVHDPEDGTAWRVVLVDGFRWSDTLGDCMIDTFEGRHNSDTLLEEFREKTKKKTPI